MKAKIPLAEAYTRARDIEEALMPYCSQIAIAGSIRRQRPTVGDIEIVCIPARPVEYTPLFMDAFSRTVCDLGDLLKGTPGGRYCQVRLPQGLCLDLFMAKPETWGYILALRTGSAEYMQAVARTWKRKGFEGRKGMMWHTRQERHIATPTEEYFFRLIGVEFRPPQDREVINLKTYQESSNL